MTDQAIPLKRPLETETATPTPTFNYQTRAKTEAATPSKATIANKYAHIISHKPIDFDPSLRFPGQNEIPLVTRRGFQYSPCAPAPRFYPVLKFSTTDAPPYKAALNVFDRSSSTQISDDFLSVTTGDGWVSARSNVCITQGRVYFEFEIQESSEEGGHVRVGITRREASMEAPVGFDGYGYGLRDVKGNILHLSRPREFEGFDGFKKGDVVGMMVELPGEREFQDVVRDQIAIRYRNRAFFEQQDYATTPEMEYLLNPITVFGEKAVADTKKKWQPVSIPKSKITVYKNGKEVGTAFEELYDFQPPHSQMKITASKFKPMNNGTLGYYPTVSVFRGGIAKINSGPDFKFKPEGDFTTLSELYESKIAEDIVWDIVDEIEAEANMDPTFATYTT